jgi:hypothetical protein
LLCLPLLAASCSRPVDDQRAIREQVANYTKALGSVENGLAVGWIRWNGRERTDRNSSVDDISVTRLSCCACGRLSR